MKHCSQKIFRVGRFPIDCCLLFLSNREGGLSDEEDAPANDSKSETKDANKSSLAEEEVATQLNSEEDYKLSAEQNDFQTIEERLKRELKYIGIFMNLPTTGESKPKAKQAKLQKNIG